MTQTEPRKCSGNTERLFMCLLVICGASQVALQVKNTPAIVGEVRDPSSVPGSGDPLEEGMANPLQYSYLENPRTEKPGRLQYVEWRRVRCK